MRGTRMTVWLVLGIWFALNIAFFSVRLYVTRERVAPNRAAADIPVRLPQLVS
jgi:hypothetical protein